MNFLDLSTNMNDSYFKFEKYHFQRKKENTLISLLIEKLKEGISNNILITGQYGIGKTALIKNIIHTENDKILTTYIDISPIYAKEKENINEEFLKLEVFESLISSLSKKINKPIDSQDIINRYSQIAPKKEKIENKVVEEQLTFELIEGSNLTLTTKFNTEYELICKKLGFPLKKTQQRPKKHDTLTHEAFKKLNDKYGLSINHKGNKNDDEEVLNVGNLLMSIPQMIIDRSRDNLKGVIFIIDEIQLIKGMENYEKFIKILLGISKEQSNVMVILISSDTKSNGLLLDMDYDKELFNDIVTIPLESFTDDELKIYLLSKFPNLTFTEKGFEIFYQITKGHPSDVNAFINILDKNKTYNDKEILDSFNDNLDYISIEWIMRWSTLSIYEKEIIITLVENKKLTWTEILNKTKCSRGTMNKYLDSLKNKGIISSRKKNYYIKSIFLTAWLKQKKENNRYYPIYYS